MGGNDLNNRLLTPQQLAHRYVDIYKDHAKVVIFCSIVYRDRPWFMSKKQFRARADLYNNSLRELAVSYPHFLYWEDRRLERYIVGSRDGVHFTEHCNLRFFFSLKLAVKQGLSLLQTIDQGQSLFFPRYIQF